jgi:hypothetical protein
MGIAFAFALGIYVLSYWFIEHRRTFKGPWEVRFEEGSNSVPVMVVNQPKLNISNVRFEFPGGVITNKLPESIQLAQPKDWPYPAGFGTIIFEDLTFLPGTVTMVCYGNEIELLPRVLSINRKQYEWKSGAVYSLVPTNPPPPIEVKKFKKKE